MRGKFEKAIVAHSQWKYHLKKAVQTGQSRFTVEEATNPHVCEFGKWLDSAEGKILPEYSELLELHNNFHEEASIILELALTGKKNEAEEKMQFGSRFSQLTSKLVNRMAALKE